MDFCTTSGDSRTSGSLEGFPGAGSLRRVLEAVGAVSWPALGFQSEVGSPVLATRMLASILIHAYSQGRLASEEIEMACQTEDDFRYLCSGDAPKACVLRRFRRLHANALVDGLAMLMTTPEASVGLPPALRERARQCLEAAIAADSLALDL